jgi:hypothetical protein
VKSHLTGLVLELMPKSVNSQHLVAEEEECLVQVIGWLVADADGIEDNLLTVLINLVNGVDKRTFVFF